MARLPILRRLWVLPLLLLPWRAWAMHVVQTSTPTASIGVGRGVVSDGSGNLYTVGSVLDASGIDQDVWLAKFSSTTLVLISSVTIDSGLGVIGSTATLPDYYGGYGLVIAPNGSIYATGAVGDPTSGDDDIWVGQFNSSLTLLSSATLDAGGFSFNHLNALPYGGYGITADAASNIYVVGSAAAPMVQTATFFVDGTSVAAVTVLGGDGTYDFSWDTTQSADGLHQLWAVAVDSSNNQFFSSTVTVTVSNSGPSFIAPILSVASPSDGSVVSGNITVWAAPSDTTSVSQVTLFLDGAPFAPATTAASNGAYSFSWDTLSIADGPHQLWAMAVDGANNQFFSSTVTVTVSNSWPLPPPTAAIASLAEGATVSASVVVSAALTGAPQIGESDLFAAKFNSSLAFLSSAAFDSGSSGFEYPYGLRAITGDGAGNFYATGAIFDAETGNDNIFVGKFDSNLGLSASAKVNAAGLGWPFSGTSIGLDPSGAVVVGGNVEGLDLNDDIWLGKLTTSLTLNSSVIQDSNGINDYSAYGMVINSTGIYVSGAQAQKNGDDDLAAERFTDALTLKSQALVDAKGIGIREPYAGYGLASDGPNGVDFFMIGAVNAPNVQNENVWLSKIDESPANLSFLQVNFTSATLQWNIDGNPPGTQYNISYYSPAKKSTVTVAALESSSTVVKGLTSNGIYSFRVQAIVPHGSADPSDPLLGQMLPAIPDNFSAVGTDSGSVTWSWSPVPGPNGADGYLFYPSTFSAVIATTQTFMTLTGLNADQADSARVRAVDVNGSSRTLSGFVTGYSLLDAPQSPKFFKVSQDSVTINWSGGPVLKTNYDISYWQASGATTTARLNLTSAQVAAGVPVAALHSNTTYYFGVRALNAQLTPSLLDPTLVIATTTLPSPILNLKVSGVDTDSVTWTWSAIAGISSYQVQPSTAAPPIITTDPAITLVAIASNTALGISVRAKNATGLGPASAFVAGTTLAEPPVGLTITQVNFTSATMNWNVSGNLAATQYKVSYWKAQGSTVAFASLSLSTVTVTGLAPNVAYTFGVQALNSKGAPTPFESFIVASTQTLPLKPGPIAGLHVVSVDSQSVTWGWQAVAGQGAASEYLIRPTSGPAIVTTDPTATIIGIASDTAAGISVRAENVTSTGPLSAIVTGYTLAEPPENLEISTVNFSSVTMHWDTNGNNPGTKYRISFWPSQGSTTTIDAVWPSSAEIKNLAANVTYYFNIQALNSKGTPTEFDPLVEQSTQTLLNLAPAPKITGADDHSLTWSWPALNGVLSYQVNQTSTGFLTTTTQPTIAFIGIASNTAASISVQAQNATGFGPLSAIVTGYTLAEPPQAITLNSVSTGSLNLTWDPDGNADGTGYWIRYWHIRGATTTVATGPLTDAQAQTAGFGVGRLSANSTYYFVVQALNSRTTPSVFDPAQVVSTKTWRSLLMPFSIPRGVKQASRSSRWAAGQVYAGKNMALRGLADSTGATRLILSLPAGFSGLGRIRIVSHSGAVVNEIDLGLVKGGLTYEASWDGRDAEGAKAPPGLYHAIFWMPGFTRTVAAKITIRR